MIDWEKFDKQWADVYYKQSKEPQMTPNERLLKAATPMTELYGKCRGTGSKTWEAMFTELEAAVKACEAADTVTVWSGTMADVIKANRAIAAPTLTDQQRRLGLRSLRHMGQDYGNYDYD